MEARGDSKLEAEGREQPSVGEKSSDDNMNSQKAPNSYVKDDQVVVLSQEHREYLVRRHGTVDLDPIPSPTDADPYNWPKWKKDVNLALVAFHAMMATFNGAAIIPAFVDLATEFQTSLQQVSYLVSLQLMILGGGPFFWRPISNRFGRRPVFLFSLLAACVCNIGCAESYSYGSMAACRALVSFFISPALAIGGAVVAETYFKKERGKYLGVWALLVTLGVPVAPFLFGFVTYHVGYQWIYWILAIVHGVQFILYLFLGPETLYMRDGTPRSGGTFKQEFFTFKRINPEPFSWVEIIGPFKYAIRPCVMVPSAAYSIIFAFASVLVTVEIPALFGVKFDFNPQEIGLQFLGIIIGASIGELLGGASSDWWMERRAKKTGSRPPAEFRLWLAYPGILITLVGTVVFLVQLDRAQPMQWNVTPIVGAAIAAGGAQLATTPLITYAVDCYYEDAAGVGVFITLCRQLWGFLGPFWYPSMFASVGLRGSAGVCSALIVGASLIPVMIVHAFGASWRPRS